MKLQVAIDRVPLDYAIEMANRLDPIVDIIELGTSIPKDFGLETIKQSDFKLQHAKLLIDLKTIDEGVYEFEKGYQAGADVLTVMGASSIDTIKKVAEVADKVDKDFLIDLMETSTEKQAQLATFDQAIFGIHHAKDQVGDFDAVTTTAQFHQQFPTAKRIAVAGGINLDTAKRLAEQGIAESVIVGSGIMKADDPIQAAKQFMEAIQS